MYTDDAGIVSLTTTSLAKMMTVLVAMRTRAVGLTVSEKKTMFTHQSEGWMQDEPSTIARDRD